MNQSRSRFCQLYRPIGALLLLLAILFLLLRSCNAPAAVVAVPTVTVLPTVVASTVAPTATPTAVPTTAPTVAPTVTPMAVPTAAPTAAPVALPKLNLPAVADFSLDGVKLSGTGQPGATVEVWDGATKVGTVVVGADGTWSLVGKLAEGAHKLVVRTVDAAGKTLNESSAVEVTVPEAETPAVADDLTASGEVHIVKAGDWLAKLADAFYGDPDLYTRIVDGTNAKAAVDPTFAQVTNPNLIEVGQKLWIPAKPASR